MGCYNVLLESCGGADTENDVEEVNIVVYVCLPPVYDVRDIIDVEDQVVVLSYGVGDLCDGQLLEGVSATNAVGDLVRDGDHWGGVK
jgi:hypothetical protein